MFKNQQSSDKYIPKYILLAISFFAEISQDHVFSYFCLKANKQLAKLEYWDIDPVTASEVK